MTDHLIDVFGRLRDALHDRDVRDEGALIETINALTYLISCLAVRARKTIPEDKLFQSANADMEKLKNYTHSRVH